MLVPKSYPSQDMMSNWSYANINPLRMSYTLPEYFYLPGLTPRSMEAEELVIFGISSLILAFAFRSSRWNKKMPGQMVTARIRENLEYDAFFAEDEEYNWWTVAWHSNKCSFFNLKESAIEMDLSIPEVHTTHFLLYLTVKDYSTEEEHTRIDKVCNVELSDTVKKCLRLLRLLTFF